MSSTIAFLFVDVKTNKEYYLKPGKQLIASNNYSESEDVDLKLACGDDVAPFLVELSVKKQSARLTCIAGYCVAKSMGIGPGGTLKLRNGTIVEFGDIECCVKMQFIIQQDESQGERADELIQMKRPKRKLPETPGIPVQPPPKPARKPSDQQPPPKPLRSREKSTSADKVAENKRKISREVNMRKDLEEGSIGYDVKEVGTKVANSICYQLMLQPNGSDLVTNKLIDDINNATKVMEQYMLSQMEKFLVTYKDHLHREATPECLLPADTPIIKHLLDILIRSPSMLEDAKEVCPVVVEILIIFCSSAQNCSSVIGNDGIEVVMTLMRMNVMQFCFELQCNCWKLLTMMVKTVADNGCNCEDRLTAAVLEVSCSLARQQLSKFDSNCPLACAITSFLVRAITFCSRGSNLASLFKTLRDGDMLQHVMSVSNIVKQNEQFKQQYSNLATLLAPKLPPTNGIESELEASGDITILVHESFKKDLDDFHVSNSLKASASTSELESLSKSNKSPSPLFPITDHFTDNLRHKSLSNSKSDSVIVRLDKSEPHRKESKVMEAFFKFLHVSPDQQVETTPHMNGHQEETKLTADVVEGQEEEAKDVVQLKSIMTNQTGSSMDLKEQTRLHTDVIDQEKQAKMEITTDLVRQQECAELSDDPTRSSLDTNDWQKQEEFTDLNDHQKQTKTSQQQRQMDMNNPYMKHTLKWQHKNKQCNSSAETNSPSRPSWNNDVSDLSHMPGTIKEFSKEQACIEEMVDAHEDIIEVLTTRINAVKTLVPLWQRGKSLQAAINAEASCFNDNDHDMVLFSDLLSLFKSHRSGWTLAVSLVFLRYFKQLLQNLSDPKYVQVIHDTLEMILERFGDIILSCKHSTANNSKLSLRLDQQQKEMCYEELQEIEELVTKELAAKTQMKTLDSITQEMVERYSKLQKILEPFKESLT